MSKRNRFGVLSEAGTEDDGVDFLYALDAKDGAKSAMILRELIYLVGWDETQIEAFKKNFYFLDHDEQLQWWNT